PPPPRRSSDLPVAGIASADPVRTAASCAVAAAGASAKARASSSPEQAARGRIKRLLHARRRGGARTTTSARPDPVAPGGRHGRGAGPAPRTASGGGPDAAGFDQNLIVWVSDTMRPRPAQ